MKQHLIAAGALTLAVAGGSAGVVAAQSAPPEIEFDVTPSAVKVADGTQIPTGNAKLTFERAGKGETGLALVRLKQGVSIEEFGKQVPNIQDPAGVHKYGRIVASTFVAGGSTYSTTIRLENADYMFVDLTKRPAPRLSFHAGPADSGAAEPRTSAKVSLRDYRFVMPSRLKPGEQTLEVTNDGKVMHHALMFPLAKGVKTSALLKKIRDGKEPRKEFAGPPSALVEMVSPKTENDVEVNLRKGKYLFVCFLQDGPKEKMHAQKGMQKIVTVR